ncbi:dirigent protein 4-like [Benincasa hispida]|uniref:dirigent protein 4-like n=1 Tax=Benincasa hispida TaxID=102211 RepID=UPI001901FCBB|nr:dirigent protein 4-like [Benincasa hispida]
MKKNMEITRLQTGLLVLFLAAISARSEYYSKTTPRVQLKEKVTNLHFFLFDILSGKKPSAVEVAHANITIGDQSATPFGSVYAIDDPLREGPHPNSKVIGNARGLYVSASQDADLCLVMYIDYGFTTGRYKGSSISVFSRNPVTERQREVAVVGGRGQFKMARGFAKLKTHYLNVTNGDAIIEYNVTVFHY